MTCPVPASRRWLDNSPLWAKAGCSLGSAFDVGFDFGVDFAFYGAA